MAYDNLKLEKGLYTTGKSFTEALEELDPSENYAGTPIEGLDAYERQLKRYNIKVSGSNSDPISKFFASTDASVLFPEYISRAVAAGISSNDAVDSVVATTTEIDSLDYRSISCFDNDFTLAEVNEGAELPTLQVELDSKLTKLKKHGKMLVASYEAIKYQKLDLFTIMLKRIGESIAESEFNQAIKVAMGSANMNMLSSSNTAITYRELIDLWMSVKPYNMDTIVTSKKDFKDILALPEFNDALAGLDFNSTGNPAKPFGINMHYCSEVDENFIAGFDSRYTVEKVQAGGVLTEFDKLIDRQLERATISTITGFSVIYESAIGLLELNCN